MAKEEWKFNAATGTMERVDQVAHGLEKKMADADVQRASKPATVPVIKSGKSLMNGVPSDRPNVVRKATSPLFRLLTATLTGSWDILQDMALTSTSTWRN